jgi:hypothetical protein
MSSSAYLRSPSQATEPRPPFALSLGKAAKIRSSARLHPM